jgi:hypothetical protein
MGDHAKPVLDFCLGTSEPLGKCQAGLQKRSRCGKMSLYINRGEAIKVHGDVEVSYSSKLRLTPETSRQYPNTRRGRYQTASGIHEQKNLCKFRESNTDPPVLQPVI